MASTVRSFWFGESLSPIEHLCVKSFVAHGHRFLLYAYDEVENVPEGCELRDASTVLDEDEVFFYETPGHVGSPSGFSNLFRYTLLDRDGGWWVDTDTLCLASKIPEPDHVFAKQEESSYNTAILRAPPGSPLIRELLTRTKRILAEQGGSIEFGSIGPYLLTDVVRDLDCADEATETAALYPIPYWDALATCDPTRRAEVEQRVARSTFVHLWTEMFRYWRVPKAARPPAGSYLAALYERYEVPSPNWIEYDWEALQSLLEPGTGFTPLAVALDYTPLATPRPGSGAAGPPETH